MTFGKAFGEREFLLLLFINLIIVILYLLWMLVLKIVWKKERIKSSFLKAGVMLLCPVVGVGFFLLGYICNRVIFFVQVDLEDVIFSKERVKPQMAAEEEQESNMVPMEEAIAVTDKDSLRNMMMNVIRGDVKSSLSAISLALSSDDSETSHYAAAALQRVLGDFRALVQNNYQKIRMEKEDETQEERLERLSLAEETIDSMAEFMEKRLLAEGEQKKYVDMLEEMCELLLTEDAKRMTAGRFRAVSMNLLEIKDYERCRKWCLQAYSQYPEELEAYVCQLKLYFAVGDREKFFRVLQELRSSDIEIDSETLELIRVFS